MSITEERLQELQALAKELQSFENRKTRRYLKVEKLLAQLTEEEQRILAPKALPPKDYASDLRYEQMFGEEAFTPLFSPAEDKFIRLNYKYASDATLAVALHMKMHHIRRRRRELGLEKAPQKKRHIVIWHTLDDFQEGTLDDARLR